MPLPAVQHMWTGDCMNHAAKGTPVLTAAPTHYPPATAAAGATCGMHVCLGPVALHQWQQEHLLQLRLNQAW